MNANIQCLHCIVSGKVQNVWFRANTEKQAKKLGINGWVRNLADGTVEIKASGTSVALNAFVQWLHIGPETARVDNVTVLQIDYEEFLTFKIL